MSQLLNERWSETKDTLLEGLQGNRRSSMQTCLENTRKYLLESVQTQKLATAFDKYLPAVMEGDAKKVAKATLTEGTAVTGDREVKAQPQVGLDNILDIRKLAGLK